MVAAPSFVDHYAVLGCTPETSASELKRAYHEKLREYHPDKRPTSSTGVGQRVTADLVNAWEVLQDQAQREAYDVLWRRERDAALSPPQRAEARRREGNELYKFAAALGKQTESLTAAAQALQKYQAAIARYSEGIELAPQDHRIHSNRALCYAALKDWPRCREDALRVTQLKPDFMKGWFLLAKAHWKEGLPIAAQRELEAGLRILPGNPELLALQSELLPDLESCRQDGVERLPRVLGGRGAASRNVSPACTPTQSTQGSRVATPPPIGSTSRGASHSPAPGGGSGSRQPSKNRGGGGGDYEGTACFGEQTACFGEQTAGFGTAPAPEGPRHGRSHGHGQARSASPAPADRYEAFAATSGPAPPIPNTARYGRDPTPPRGPDGPRQRSTLAGMVASSRVGLQ